MLFRSLSQEQMFVEYTPDISPPSSPKQEINNAAQTYQVTMPLPNNDDSLKDYLKKYKFFFTFRRYRRFWI